MNAYRRTAAALAVLLVLASVLALVVTEDRWDTVLGAVSGACAALLLGCLLGIAVERRRRRAEADTEALDRLEPLRADGRRGA